MNIDELVAYLPANYKATKQKIYGWVCENLIPHRKEEGSYYFVKEEIDKWVASGRQKTIAEIDAESGK